MSHNYNRSEKGAIMKSLDQLRSAFKTPERDGSVMPNNYYPFWNMPEGDQSIVRFLPDGNDDNPLGFLVEKVMHNLIINGERKSVPCLSMYGEDCPICAVSQQHYKADNKEMGKRYWKKKQHLAQVLVVEDSLPPENSDSESHEGKVRYVALGFQLFNIIKASFEDGELDDVPFAYEGGTNFIIKKTKQGDYPSYSLSKFARKSTDIDDDVVANLDLIDLSTLLPKNPGLERIQAMLEADLTGDDFSDSTTTQTEKPKDELKAAVSKLENTSSTDEDDDSMSDEADDILAQIRSRRKAKES